MCARKICLNPDDVLKGKVFISPTEISEYEFGMNRFERFKRRAELSVLSYKPKFEIKIYGSYYPNEEKDRLKNLRDFLKADGYKEAKLVEDQPNGMDPWQKSCLSLEFADVNFFLFTHKGKGQGATNELTYVCNDLPDRVWRCVAFIENVGRHLATSQLNLKMMRFVKMDIAEFNSDKDLFELARGKAFYYLRRLSNELRYR